MTWRTDRACAAEMDAADPLRTFRGRFWIPTAPDGNEAAYLCGHSLGLAPRSASSLVDEEMASWQRLAVEGHFSGQRPWLSYHEQLNAGLAMLTGSQPHEVVAMNALTVNLHLMLVSFYRPTASRFRILVERAAFPSDRYAVASQIEFHGLDPREAMLEVGPREGESLIRTEDIATLLASHGDTIATVLLPGVQYLTGQCLEMQKITQLARAYGCTVGFDLAHAIGNVPLQLHHWDVDFAVWCSYKYLNGGPGAIGGCFVHERHAQNTALPRFAGWWGHDKQTRFAMPTAFEPLRGAEGWQLSNPPILAMAPLLASLALFREAGAAPLAAKARQLSSYMMYLLQTRLADHLEVLTPALAEHRGCQISLRLKLERSQARAAYESVARQEIVCDWREPDVLRAAAVPLYNSFDDVWKFVNALSNVLH